MLPSQEAPALSALPTAQPESLPYNDKALHRLIVLAVIKLLRRHRPWHGPVLMISKRICIKYSRLVNLSEASTMRFIARHTSIPVPKVICAFELRGKTYIVMERIDGVMVGKGWPNRSDESRTKTLLHLKGMIQELRSLSPPPGTVIGNVDGGPLHDSRLPGSSLSHGPFSNVGEFHDHLRCGLQLDSRLSSELKQLITFHRGHWPLKFTHGDLNSLNMLVRGDTVVGIVDWEMAGWYPAYWEYTAACQVNLANPFWRAEIDRFLDPQPAEQAMEQIRQKYFGDV